MNDAFLRQKVLLWSGRILKWSKVAGLGARWGWIRGELPPADRAEGETDSTQSLRHMQMFGFRSAPPDGTELIVGEPRAGAVNAAVVASDNLGTGPTDLQVGDVVVYSGAHMEGATCVIRLLKVGEISATPKSGQKVKLGDTADANLDAVVLYTQLKAQFDALVNIVNTHTHVVPLVTAGPANITSNVTTTSASNLTAAVQSSNVVAKKI